MPPSSPVEVFTTSNVLLDALVEAGIKRAFVNLGSDHPALLEAFAHRKKYGLDSLEIVTCPNEVSPAPEPLSLESARSNKSHSCTRLDPQCRVDDDARVGQRKGTRRHER